MSYLQIATHSNRIPLSPSTKRQSKITQNSNIYLINNLLLGCLADILQSCIKYTITEILFHFVRNRFYKHIAAIIFRWNRVIELFNNIKTFPTHLTFASSRSWAVKSSELIQSTAESKTEIVFAILGSLRINQWIPIRIKFQQLFF